MTDLHFELPGELDLPVEVYDQSQRLVGRALSSDSVPVGPGRYFVEARLPDGSRRQRTVEVEGEGEREVFLGREMEPVGVVATGGIAASDRFYLEPQRELSEGILRRLAEEEPRAWLQCFRWHRLGGWEAAARQPLFSWHAKVGFDIRGREWRALGLQQPDGRMALVPIPGGRTDLLRFELTDVGGALHLRARVASGAAHALLAFLDLGLIADADLLSHSRALQGEYLLQKKVSDPIAAAAGAVALLRMNELERLHDWTANLADWFSWLPDGAAVRAEHLALAGRHEEAAALLRDLPERGLPVLSAALGFATDRLRTYSSYWPEDRELRHATILLTSYALATDFSQPVTTFSGRDPDSPEGASPESDRGTNPSSEGAREPVAAEEIA